MKILATPTGFLSAANAPAREKLESFADEVVYNRTGHPLSEAELIPLIADVDGYLAGVDGITRSALLAGKKLRALSRYGVGVDSVDLDAAKELSVAVSNTPGANSNAVCELAFGLMLALARDIIPMSEGIVSGVWEKHGGCELYGKTLGIMGLGQIGKRLAVRARAFGMRVLAYDKYFDAAFAKAQGVEYAGAEQLLLSSDFVSLHLPLTPETRGLIDGSMLSRMKKGVFIVNTARGGIVDEAAAAEAIISGQLGGIALDAFVQEPLRESPLIGLPHVILTPHIGAATAEAAAAMGMMATDNLIAMLKNEECKCRIV